MIVITGATGQLGSRVVQQLLLRVPPSEVTVTTRDTSKLLPSIASAGINMHEADYKQPATLVKAFTGADKVLIVSSNDTAPGAGEQQNKAAIDAAIEAKVKTIYYTSHMGASSTSAFSAMHTHAGTEAYLEKQLAEHGGFDFVSLRNGYYTSAISLILGNATQTGTLFAPVDGPVSWTTHDDLAEATAVILAADKPGFTGRYPTLTGGEALDLDAVTERLSKVYGKQINHVKVSDEAAKDGMVKGGLPPFLADFFLTMYVAMRNDEFVKVDPLLSRLLGRKAETVDEYFARQVASP